MNAKCQPLSALTVNCVCVRRIGIGFNTQAAMVGSDAVVAQPSSNEVQQYELGAKSLANVVVDPQQGVFNTTLLQAGGWTIMRFSRHLAANGTGDVPIRRDGSTPVVWAYGASNAFMYVWHGC